MQLERERETTGSAPVLAVDPLEEQLDGLRASGFSFAAMPEGYPSFTHDNHDA